MVEDKKVKILCVCLGNICRSPTAEAILKKIAREQNLLSGVHIESAGTSHYHIGEPPDPRTCYHGEKRGLQFESLAQQFRPEIHFETFDFILCMDSKNLSDIRKLDPEGIYQHKIQAIMSYYRNAPFDHIPDPYYGEAKDFEIVIDLLEQCCWNFWKTHIKGN